MMKQGDTTSIWGNDRVQFVLYPQIYTDFIFELMKNHGDLVEAMVLAQVRIEDGSALDFLNTFLGTTVTKDMPMEIGYAQLLDALKMRATTAISQAAIARVARQFGNHSLFPARSNPDKPIFDDEKPKQ